LAGLFKKGKHSVRKLKRAKVLLLLETDKQVAAIAQEAGVSEATVYNVYHRYKPGKLSEALEERLRSGQPRKVTQRLEAEVTRIACSEAPEGRSRWTINLIHQQVVALGYQVGDESVRQVLKKVTSSRGKKDSGVLAK
jgi:transposase